MKNVLLLGAGFVARPLVRYLLDQPFIQLIIASRTLQKAENLLEGHPQGKAYQLNIENTRSLETFIKQADVVISLLPWIHHLTVANMCLDLNKHLITTSYIKPEMKVLDKKAREKGLMFLNEIGVDPGIDHMAAMRIINHIKKKGGNIKSFYSYCGGLPSLEHNTNPLGYKFSWSPAGVMLAANNDGRYLKDGEVIEVPGKQLFEHYWLVDIPGAATFEAYVNRDALPYIELYGLGAIQSMYRGTLRNISHCETWNYFKKLGLLDQNKVFNFGQMSVREVLAILVNGKVHQLPDDVASFLQIPPYSVTIKKMEWLGLFDVQKLPIGEASVFDMFAHILQKKLVYEDGEVDLLVQYHEFIAEYPDGRSEKITSTLVDTGIPGGDSSMARTVSLPAAIATRLLLEGKLDVNGVHLPVLPEIYEPVLEELESLNIKLTEAVETINT